MTETIQITLEVDADRDRDSYNQSKVNINSISLVAHSGYHEFEAKEGHEATQKLLLALSEIAGESSICSPLNDWTLYKESTLFDFLERALAQDLPHLPDTSQCDEDDYQAKAQKEEKDMENDTRNS